MGLVERVGDDVQQRHRIGAQPALQQHEAHLGDRRIGQGDLDRGLSQHDQRSQHRADRADGRQQAQRGRMLQDEPAEPQHQEPARIDHAGVQQGRDRRGRLHHLEDPAVERDLRRAQDRRGRQQHGARAPRRPGRAPARVQDHGDVAVARRAPQAGGGDDQGGVGEAAEEEPLAGGQHGGLAVGPEQQQPIDAQAGGDPAQDQLAQIAGQNQALQQAQGQAELANEHWLARIPGQVIAAVDHDHQADEGHQAGQGRAQGVDPDRQAQPRRAERRRRGRAP